jgi:L-ascorbate metabolism protein UlaG (beta-lactamase superfamily)
MRLKAGRPSLRRYTALFDVPPATGELSVTFLGVSTLLLTDGESAILTDGFFTRPPMLRTLLGRIGPDRARIDESLARAGVSTSSTTGDTGRLEAVVPVHSHYDHALDSAAVAERTGAVLVGGESTANLGRGHGLPAGQILVAAPGAPIELGAWTVTLVESHHCPPDRFPGEITEPVVMPTKVGSFKCGEAWSVLARHRSGTSALIQGSAGFVPGALAGHRADVAYLGVGMLGLQPASYIEDYWAETVRTVGARRAVLTHWDDFFRSLDQPLRALPYAGDDLDVTISVLSRLAEQDGVALALPTLWQRQDPWA